MKKKNIINLIKYHIEKKDSEFKAEAIECARFFDSVGDSQLSEYIISLISNTNSFIPQNEYFQGGFIKKMETFSTPLPLPKLIAEDIIGIVNAIKHRAGVNKFLFQGSPGTGKTESAKHIARLLDRELYIADFTSLVDSKLGQTNKNIASLFDELNKLPYPEKVIILFDEIDAIALDRINDNDSREMGRATSALLRELDNLKPEVTLIATTNLYNKFDKALTRRFDAEINFNRYSREELVESAEAVLSDLLLRFKNAGRDMKLFRKIISQLEPMPFPGELVNIIKTSLAFSNPDYEYDYLKRLFTYCVPSNEINDLNKIYKRNFTLREIEVITGISKSQVARELKENKA